MIKIAAEGIRLVDMGKPSVFKIREKFHKRWLTYSLRQKIRMITGPAAAAVFLAVLAALSIAVFGMTGFHTILENNAKSLDFRVAVEQESRRFASFIQDSGEENRDAYLEACRNTRETLAALPYDYDRMGADRYAKTWSIKNSFETYEKKKEQFFFTDPSGDDYVQKLYEIYSIQEYLQSYAGSLQQMNEEEGNYQYRRLVPLFMLVPVCTVIFAAAAAVVIWRMNRLLERNLVQPVLELSGESNRIARNDFSGPDLSPEGEDEIADLVRAFMVMKHSTKGYITTLKEKHEMEKQLDAVRLQMLKNQINPHFLFNTLNMIVGMAQVEEAETTEKMITAMSRLFRYNLKSTASVMPLEREIKVVEDYIYLQKMRFGSRIRYAADCSLETADLLIPSFALQPIVENAIVHGISEKPEGGKIYIRSWMEGKKLWISVADTGRGISKERLEEIKAALVQGKEDQTGVGIGNIYRRLHTMYQDGELYLYSKENCGTVVQISFTAEEEG